MLKKNDISELSAHVRSLIVSLTSHEEPLNEQFELHGINLIEICVSSVARYKRKGMKVCTVPNDVDNATRKSLQGLFPADNNGQCANTVDAKITLIDLPFLVTQKSQNARKRTLNPKTTNNITCTASLPKKRPCNPNSDIVVEFHKMVSKGPEYVCTSCSQVFFRHSVICMNRDNYKSNLMSVCVKGTKSVGDVEYICNHCHGYMKKNKVPPCSIGNKLKFPDIPIELQELTQLEQLLISPRIPFMQIRELPRGGQMGLKGNVVNVPADVNKTVNATTLRASIKTTQL